MGNNAAFKKTEHSKTVPEKKIDRDREEMRFGTECNLWFDIG